MSPTIDALNASFWQYGAGMLERLCEEPEASLNKELVPETQYYRHSVSECEIDYRRAVLSLPLRGLQGKTQVFPSDKEYFVRSRLTHTLEVAATASDIFEEMVAAARKAREGKTSDSHDMSDLLSNEELTAIKFALSTACLLHDAGNPPFGHFGEEVIRNWFSARPGQQHSDARPGQQDSDARPGQQDSDLLWYEGNANSLRMALRGTGLYDGRRMNPTLLTLSAMVKYPWTSRTATALGKPGKYNYFASDEDLLERLFSKSAGFVRLGEGERSKLSFVMEAADDISYATSDFEDAFRKGKFSIGEVLDFLLQRWDDLRKPSKDGKRSKYVASQRKNTFSLVYMLAFIAGSPEDFAKLQRFIGDGIPGDDNLIAKNGEIGRTYCFFLVDDSASPVAEKRGEKTVHTFRSALAAYSDQQLDASQKRQMQETYVGRWVDVVRKWLCFCSAKSLGLQAPKGTGDGVLFGDHLMTIDLLKEVLGHFVYDAPENAKLNARAETVLRGLLDKFVPAAEECIQVQLDEKGEVQLDEEGKVSFSLDSPVRPGESVSSTSAALLALIPLRYRLDYQEHANRLSDGWDIDRCRYELDMMVLDFISSLPDDYAVRLYNELYRGE